MEFAQCFNFQGEILLSIGFSFFVNEFLKLWEVNLFFEVVLEGHVEEIYCIFLCSTINELTQGDFNNYSNVPFLLLGQVFKFRDLNYI